MKAIAAQDRPREKLVRAGAGALGDNELVALVLGQGQPRTSALDLANTVLGAVGSVAALARATHGELTRIRGIGVARAAQVLAAVELGRRSVACAAAERPQMTSPRAVAEYLLAQYGNHRVEQFGGPAPRYEASRPAQHRPVGRDARRQHRAPPGDIPRSGGGRRRRDR